MRSRWTCMKMCKKSVQQIGWMWVIWNSVCVTGNVWKRWRLLYPESVSETKHEIWTPCRIIMNVNVGIVPWRCICRPCSPQAHTDGHTDAVGPPAPPGSPPHSGLPHLQPHYPWIFPHTTIYKRNINIYELHNTTFVVVVTKIHLRTHLCSTSVYDNQTERI